ncbi:unnamed protein product, partial [Polarella glacialis]
VRLRKSYSASRTVDMTLCRVHGILDMLMPPLVVKEIREKPANALVLSHEYNAATIAQSDLCGFTAIASMREPAEVVTFISEIFGLFDELTDRYGVCKIETVGDAYIAGQAEVPLTRENSPISVALFALGMVEATHNWSRMKGESVSCRVGIHSGRCVGGIV